MCTIGHQTSRFDELPIAVYCWQPRAERQAVDANPVGDHRRVGTDVKCVHTALESLKGSRDILGSLYF